MVRRVRLRLEAVAWRMATAQTLSRVLVPPYSLRRVRAAVLRAGGARVTLGAEIAGWTRIAHPNVSIGRGSFIGPQCLLVPTRDAAITIGCGASLGPRVTLVTVSHEIGDPSRRAGQPTSAPITVGDGAWIGVGAIILPGVSIGAGAIVAAGAVVTEDVAANALVGGVPARLIRVI